MYKKLSAKSKFLFWIINVGLLVLLIYSITLISSANIYELIIAGLGWMYILGTILLYFGFMPEIFVMRKDVRIMAFSIIAIIGIIAAIVLNIVLNVTRLPEALPITLIPAVIVIAYFAVILFRIKKK